jgi:hypothetical protein
MPKPCRWLLPLWHRRQPEAVDSAFPGGHFLDIFGSSGRLAGKEFVFLAAYTYIVFGPRTLQSLALVSEVIHGTPSRFRDPARFAFAHGGKDGHPFPVPIKVYDETIGILQTAVHKARLGQSEKLDAIKALGNLARAAEKYFVPAGGLSEYIEKERDDSWKYGGRTVFGRAKPRKPAGPVQMLLF